MNTPKDRELKGKSEEGGLMEANGRRLRGWCHQPPQMLPRVQDRLKFIVFSNKDAMGDPL